MTAFATLGLSAPLIQALQEQGYVSPSPIQIQAIPKVLQGRDLFAAAQTGTGKTASFALPILQRLSESSVADSGVRALVLVPTRELAAQVEERIGAYASGLPLRSVVVHGGVPVEPQIALLQKGVDILVATPGRLLDLLYQEALTLANVETLVLDEADRMLDLGFIDEVQHILDRLPIERQNLLFSATFSAPVVELAGRMMVDPERVEISPANSAAEMVDQSVYAVEWDDKPDTVRYLIEEGRWSRALVFIRTKKSADDLVDYLVAEGMSAAAIHSNKSQILRTRTLAAFKKGDVRILVATDIAARGLDIAELPLVINYDLPRVAQDYVHRIGRSGRAGQEGRAMSLLSGSERKWLSGIEKLLKRRLDAEPLPFYDNGIEQPTDTVVPGKRANKARKQIKPVRARNFKQKRNLPVKPSDQKAPVRKGSARPVGSSVSEGSVFDSKPVREPRNSSGDRSRAAKTKPAGPWAKSATKPAAADPAAGQKQRTKAAKPVKKQRPLPFSGKK